MSWSFFISYVLFNVDVHDKEKTERPMKISFIKNNMI